MDRSTDSRRARNSDSVMIGGRRRPVSRPSRRRCFLASSLVEPLTERTSSLPFGSRTCTTVSGGSSEPGASGPSPAEPRRRLRRRRLPLPPASPSPSASADPPASPSPLSPAGASAAGASGLASVPSPPPLLAVLRLRLREDDRRLSPWPPSALLPEPVLPPEPAPPAGLADPAASALLPEPA